MVIFLLRFLFSVRIHASSIFDRFYLVCGSDVDRVLGEIHVRCDVNGWVGRELQACFISNSLDGLDQSLVQGRILPLRNRVGVNGYGEHVRGERTTILPLDQVGLHRLRKFLYNQIFHAESR